ncbi:MAG: hypothetical protein R3Y28_01875 [Candidatus Gastranaerophilales bacterium]
MIEVHINENEVKKYLYFASIMNVVLPSVLETLDLVVFVQSETDENHVHCLSYTTFMQKYDHSGLNQVVI